MPPSIDEDEFGDGDFDEADLLDLVPAKGPGQEGSIDTDGFDDNDLHAQGTKRKASSDGNTSPKRLQTSFPCAVAALTGKFGFKSFQLKQEQVNALFVSQLLEQTFAHRYLGHLENSIWPKRDSGLSHRRR
jgi:hypothetical protein